MEIGTKPIDYYTDDKGIVHPIFDAGVIAGLTVGSVLFAGAGGIISQDNSNLFWDDTNKRLGIGTASPARKLEVYPDTDEVIILGRVKVGDITGVGDWAGMAHIDHANLTDYAFIQDNNGKTYFNSSAGQDMAFRINNITQMAMKSNGRVGLNQQINPNRDLDLNTDGQMTFGDNIVTNNERGIYWHTGSDYGIYRTTGAWSGDFQQLKIKWLTGIVIDGGSAYGKSGTVLQPSGGNVGIGTASPATSALLDLTSTIGALLVSRMTTTQRDALTAINGMIIYNSTTNAFNFYEAGAWVTGSGLA